MALGFNNGVPHESDVTKFVNKIGDDIESINSFVTKMREKMDILDAISLSR